MPNIEKILTDTVRKYSNDGSRYAPPTGFWGNLTPGASFEMTKGERMNPWSREDTERTLGITFTSTTTPLNTSSRFAFSEDSGTHVTSNIRAPRLTTLSSLPPVHVELAMEPLFSTLKVPDVRTCNFGGYIAYTHDLWCRNSLRILPGSFVEFDSPDGARIAMVTVGTHPDTVSVRCMWRAERLGLSNDPQELLQDMESHFISTSQISKVLNVTRTAERTPDTQFHWNRAYDHATNTIHDLFPVTPFASLRATANRHFGQQDQNFLWCLKQVAQELNHFLKLRSKSKTLAKCVTIPRVSLEFFSNLAMRIQEDEGNFTRRKTTYQFSLMSPENALDVFGEEEWWTLTSGAAVTKAIFPITLSFDVSKGNKLRVSFAGMAQQSLDGVEVWNTQRAPKSRKRKAAEVEVLEEPEPPKVLRPMFRSGPDSYY